MRTPEDNQPAGGELFRFGRVAEVDLAAARCRVDVGDCESGWIRWSEFRAGATRSWSPPTEGEQVLVMAPEGELEAAIAVRGFVSDNFPAPGNSLRELIQFQDDAVVAYDPEDHVLDVALPAGARVNIIAAGGVTIEAADGGVAIKGDVTVEGKITASDDVLVGAISLKSHKHGGVQVGGAQSGGPL